MSAPARMPAVFFGHGNPMNALADNAYTQAWKRLGAQLPPPRAVLCVSAHWYIPATAVTAMPHPRAIHDFGGFPRELYAVEYPAPGSPELAQRVAELLGRDRTRLDDDWGLDHGTWSVLLHVFPNADVPVVQLSIDETMAAVDHYALARQLRPLRDEGVLIVGSGNLVHNLHAYSWGRHAVEPYPWAIRFESTVRSHLQQGEFSPLIAYEALGPDALLSAPTPEHYLPLLYVIGQHVPDEPVSFPVEGFDGGSISMLSIRIG